jgi:molybdopterin-binding protein
MSLVRGQRAELFSASVPLSPFRLFSPEFAMLSARNQLPATVKSVKLGNVMAEVIMSMGNVEIVAAITRGSAEAMNLKPGDAVKAVIKSTEILIDKP